MCGCEDFVVYMTRYGPVLRVYGAFYVVQAFMDPPDDSCARFWTTDTDDPEVLTCSTS